MSNKLSVPQTGMTPNVVTAGHRTGNSSVREWITSPIGRALVQALPDVLRMASRPRQTESTPLAAQVLPSSNGASGMTLSEVEVDVDVPFIRRLTIRSASSWTVAPEMILAEQKKQRRKRWKLRALTAGLLGVAGVVLARRTGVSLPAKVNPAASLPYLMSGSTTRNPGTAE